MEEEIKEIQIENKKDKTQEVINPLDYVTIPVKEYRKLIKKAEKLKRERNEQRHMRYKYYAEVNELKEIIEAYKNDLRKMVGLDELKKVSEQDA